MPKTRFRSYFYMLLSTVLWSLAFVLIKPTYEVTTPFRFLMYRFGIASVLSLPVLIYFWRKMKPSTQTVAAIVGIELIGNTFALGLLYTGLLYISAIEANLLAVTVPLFVTLGSIFLLKEKEEKNEWIGLGVSLLGTIGLVLLPLTTHYWNPTYSILGGLCILGHNILNTFYFPLTKKYYQKLPKLFVSTVSFYMGFISFSLLSLLEAQLQGESLWAHIQFDLHFPSVWIASAYMATFGSIIAFYAYIKGQEGLEASEAILFTYLSPVFAIPAAYFLLGEKIQPLQLLLLGVILLGVWIAERRVPKNMLTS